MSGQSLRLEKGRADILDWGSVLTRAAEYGVGYKGNADSKNQAIPESVREMKFKGHCGIHPACSLVLQI